MPNTDIRVQVTFPSHWKTRKLEKLAGHEGIKCLIYLWIFVAVNKPDGKLTDMNEEDIETAAYWNGDPGVFVDALCNCKFLVGDVGNYEIKDWKEHQPWAANAKKRSKAARKAGQASGTVRQRKANGKRTDAERKTNGSGTPILSSPIPSLPLPKEPPPSAYVEFINQILLDNSFTDGQMVKQCEALGKLIDKYGQDEVFAVLKWGSEDTEKSGTFPGWKAVFHSIERLRANGNEKYLNMKGSYNAQPEQQPVVEHPLWEGAE